MITFARTEDVTHEWTWLDMRQQEISPVILAAMQTFEGDNTANVRLDSFQNLSYSLPGLAGDEPVSFQIFLPRVKIEEEGSGDVEVKHTQEVVGHIAFEPDGRIEDISGNEIGHAGIIETNQPDGDTWRRLPDIPDSFSVDRDVAFVQVLTFNGSQPTHARIARSHPETDESGFHFKMEEWPSQDERHTREKLGYVVLKQGRHSLSIGEAPDLDVGLIDSVRYMDEEDEEDNWYESREFDNLSGSGPPVVVAQCQTFNGPDPVTTRQRMLGPADAPDRFEVRLQEAELPSEDRDYPGEERSHQAEEDIGFVAMGVPLF